MKSKTYPVSACWKKPLGLLVLLMALLTLSLSAQDNEAASAQQIKPLRSDVGINGLTANFKFLNSYRYLGQETLLPDSNSELEFVFRDVRTVSPRLGVGFQVLASIFVDDFSNFGVGSWGLGPVVRAYPFKTNRWQPYAQANVLFGNNLAVGDLSDTQNGGDGFRIRLGLHAGLAYRLMNELGLFVEVGPDWESSRLFKSDASVIQVNVGIDLYRFN